MIHIKKI